MTNKQSEGKSGCERLGHLSFRTVFSFTFCLLLTQRTIKGKIGVTRYIYKQGDCYITSSRGFLPVDSWRKTTFSLDTSKCRSVHAFS